MTKTSKHIVSLIVALTVVSLALLGSIISRPMVVGASVSQGSDYTSTSTAGHAMYGAQTASVLVKTGQGAVGSLVITGANTGIVNLYNATTTNIEQRASSKSTSTILIASFPASTAAGTYTIDAVFTDGLYLSLASGNMPTTTLTYR